MLININKKPIQVRQKEDSPDVMYGIVKCSAIALSLVPINAACKAFLGVSFFAGFISDFTRLFSWFF